MAKSDSKLKAAPRDAGKAKTKKTKKDKDMPKGQKKGKSASEKPQTSSGNELLASIMAERRVVVRKGRAPGGWSMPGSAEPLSLL